MLMCVHFLKNEKYAVLNGFNQSTAVLNNLKTVYIKDIYSIY